MMLTAETVELFVAVVVGVLGKLGYDKGRSIISNGRSGYLTRESHDRECGLKLKPITDSLERIEDHVRRISNKQERDNAS